MAMKTQRLRVWGIGAVLACASAVLYVGMADPGQDRVVDAVQSDTAIGDEQAPPALVPSGSSNRSADMSAGQSRPMGRTELSSVDQLDRITSAEGLDTELLARAWAGDTTAMAALGELAFRCGQFDPARRDYAPRLVEKAPAGTPERAARETAARLLMEYCGTSYRSFAAGGPVDEILKMLRESAERGDLIAKADGYFFREDETQLLDILSTSDDIWVIERALGRLVTQRAGQIGQVIDREVFANPENKIENDRVKISAARWRACELGAPCGPNQPYELLTCLQHGRCSLGMDVRSHIQQRELSGFQFELMQKYLAALDARLAEQGITLRAMHSQGR